MVRAGIGVGGRGRRDGGISTGSVVIMGILDMGWCFVGKSHSVYKVGKSDGRYSVVWYGSVGFDIHHFLFHFLCRFTCLCLYSMWLATV